MPIAGQSCRSPLGVSWHYQCHLLTLVLKPHLGSRVAPSHLGSSLLLTNPATVPKHSREAHAPTCSDILSPMLGQGRVRVPGLDPGVPRAVSWIRFWPYGVPDPRPSHTPCFRRLRLCPLSCPPAPLPGSRFILYPLLSSFLPPGPLCGQFAHGRYWLFSPRRRQLRAVTPNHTGAVSDHSPPRVEMGL